jgi:hypothetical protein
VRAHVRKMTFTAARIYDVVGSVPLVPGTAVQAANAFDCGSDAGALGQSLSQRRQPVSFLRVRRSAARGDLGPEVPTWACACMRSASRCVHTGAALECSGFALLAEQDENERERDPFQAQACMALPDAAATLIRAGDYDDDAQPESAKVALLIDSRRLLAETGARRHASLSPAWERRGR